MFEFIHAAATTSIGCFHLTSRSSVGGQEVKSSLVAEDLSRREKLQCFAEFTAAENCADREKNIYIFFFFVVPKVDVVHKNLTDNAVKRSGLC